MPSRVKRKNNAWYVVTKDANRKENWIPCLLFGEATDEREALMRRTDSPSRLSRNGRLFWRPTTSARHGGRARERRHATLVRSPPPLDTQATIEPK